MRLASCAVLIAAGLCACERWPEAYPVPAQQPTFEDAERWERIVHMTDVDAHDHFTGDIFDPLSANWRWTGKKPLIRLNAPAGVRRNYSIQFVIPDAAFRVTGPVTLTFLVNGHVLDRRSYSAAGPYTFEKEVPSEWISGGETTLGAQIDKTYKAENQPAYGFLMVAIGLKRI